MARLTEKHKKYDAYSVRNKEYDITEMSGEGMCDLVAPLIHKLGQLEDIEEKYGIDLISLFSEKTLYEIKR